MSLEVSCIFDNGAIKTFSGLIFSILTKDKSTMLLHVFFDWFALRLSNKLKESNEHFSLKNSAAKVD